MVWIMKLNHLLDNDRPVKTKTHLIHAKTWKNACENWRQLRFCFMKLGPGWENIRIQILQLQKKKLFL